MRRPSGHHQPQQRRKTLVEGISRADRDLYQVMKTHRLRYAHDLGQWYLPRSRGHAPGPLAIDRLADALRKAGCKVTVEVDATPADGAEREQAVAEGFDEGGRVRIKGDDVGTVVQVDPKTLTVDTGLLPWPLRSPDADVQPLQPTERGQ